MQLLVNPTSYQNAQLLITKKVHRIFVGTKEFSVRNSCLLTIEEIGELVKNKNQTEIIILVNKLFFEFELEKLEQYILAISKLNIDGIMYADYAVNQILFENNLNHIHQIYNPDTLVTNYEQFPFYLQNNIHEVSLARELTGTNIVKCIENKKEMKVQVQVGGYGLMLQSR
jgi:collagenase-like PrtC family protease